jgi:hypothetical protein
MRRNERNLSRFCLLAHGFSSGFSAGPRTLSAGVRAKRAPVVQAPPGGNDLGMRERVPALPVHPALQRVSSAVQRASAAAAANSAACGSSEAPVAATGKAAPPSSASRRDSGRTSGVAKKDA